MTPNRRRMDASSLQSLIILKDNLGLWDAGDQEMLLIENASNRFQLSELLRWIVLIIIELCKSILER